MPRKSRIVIGGYPHHIIQRGHNRQVIFASDDDYLYYLDNLHEWKEKLGCLVYAYCLMTNHIHLIIDPGKEAGNLAQLMKRVNGRRVAMLMDDAEHWVPRAKTKSCPCVVNNSKSYEYCS
ncbi:MAG: transposase [Syntrophales bacterium]|nr:transposase [Syntrophales bacterium]